ncbi:MAG: CDP-alcohol phosphatidyltransferase family protein [Pseudorhodoplanes sp.]
MFDRLLLTSQKRVLQGPARWLSVRGVSADSITLGGFLFGLVAFALLAQQLYAAALAFIILNRIFDGLDGAIARERGPTDRGAFMDIALDFFFYATIPFGFALADPAENALAASALLLAFVGTGSSFLAFSVIAAKRGISSTSFPHKGIYYLGGLTEGTETFIAFAAMCIWPASFAAVALAFTILALITAATRWWWGWHIFSEKN